ncbi:MAG: hypothetical protein MJ222_04825 [Bacilli bacterium]|nr:hypothetical protein [Bacilli bacterium]
MAYFRGHSHYINDEDVIDVEAHFTDFEDEFDDDFDDDDAEFFDNDPFFVEEKKSHRGLPTKAKIIMMLPMMFFSMFIMFCRFIGEFMIDIIDDLRD